MYLSVLALVQAPLWSTTSATPLAEPSEPEPPNPQYNPELHAQDKIEKPPGFLAENFSPEAFKVMFRFMYLGFKGEGSI